MSQSLGSQYSHLCAYLSYAVGLLPLVIGFVFVSNLALIKKAAMYRLLMYGQLAFNLSASLGPICEKLRRSLFLTWAHFLPW